MSEWVALTTSCPDTPCGPGRGTTPEWIDLTTDVMAYCYDHAGHHIAKMRIGAVGVVREAYYDDGVLLTTEELCAIPPVADLLEACEIAAGRTGEVQAMMTREGFVIDDLDDRWQKFAFTLYTMLAADAGHAERAIAKVRVEEH